MTNKQLQTLFREFEEIIGEDEKVSVRYSGGVYINDKRHSDGLTLTNVGKLQKECEKRNYFKAEQRQQLKQLKEKYEVFT